MALIVFDWDGVLFEGVKIKLHAFGQACREKAKLPSRFAIEHYWDGGRNNFEVFEQEYRKHFGRKPPAGLAEEVNAHYLLLLKGKIEKAGLFKDVASGLAALKQDGHTLAISSSATPESLRRLMRSHQVLHHFSEVLGTSRKRPSFTKGTPHLSHLLQKYSLPRIFFVGDAPEDMRIGKEFGAIPVGRIGTCTKERLRKAGAKYAITTLHELRKIVQA
jgi:phosphoglycolate phosphatase-like HAD superfamily hydrolase